MNIPTGYQQVGRAITICIEKSAILVFFHFYTVCEGMTNELSVLLLHEEPAAEIKSTANEEVIEPIVTRASAMSR